MQMIEANQIQLTSLILPSPAVVIDTRGADDEDVMARLRIEILDLVGEMKTQEIHHWRYLTEFLSFLNYEPMTCEEVNSLRPPSQHNSQDGQTTSPPVGRSSSPESGLTGKIDPSTIRGIATPFFYQEGDDIASLTENGPGDILKQNIHRLTQEVDRLRNNRHVAVGDLDKLMSGRSIKDATVRVLFLTDVERPDSLATTALYSAQLKQFYAQKERQDEQPMISTAVICLNNSGDATPSPDYKELLWNDNWEHIDALILTEDYRQDAANIAGAVQAYIAELLLYVLMIAPPMRVEPRSQHFQNHNGKTTFDASTADDMNTEDVHEDKKGRSIAFPPYTFLVGLAAMEHSARWGRRLLNYRLVERSIEILQKGSENERPRAKSIALGWLNSWRQLVRSAIPDKVPGGIDALQAIPRASKAVKSGERVFRARDFNLNIGQSTIEDLEGYRDTLVHTYTFSSAPNGVGYTLQDAIDSIPQIERHLREWEHKDPALRRGTPLVNAQLEAHRVLSHRDFYSGASGAIPRARMELEELNTAISNLRSEHQQNPIELQERSQKLNENGSGKIDELKKHVESIPFLGTVLRLKSVMAWLSLFIALFLSAIATFLGVAWLRHLILQSNFINLVNNLLLPSVSPFALVFWVLVLAIVLALAYVLGRRVLNPTLSAIRVEVIFWLGLIVLTIFGVTISLSFGGLAQDPLSAAIIDWLGFLPFMGAVIFIIALVIAVVEVTYFLWWYRHLKDNRTQIVDELNSEHQKNIADVVSFIADTIALHLLVRTGLTGEKGGPGEYYQRMNQLNMRLRDILDSAQKQQRLARERLAMSVSETQRGAGNGNGMGPQGPWLNLRIRDERLDVESLADGYSRLTDSLDQESAELKEFAELLLRAMGEETSAEIEQQFRERIPARGSMEQHSASVLMGTLVAVALRLLINATSIYSMTPLIQQYDSVAISLGREPTAMKSLIENLRKKVRQNMLQPITEGRVKPADLETNILATSAFAAWGQMLWEGRDAALDRTLSSEGVLPKLLTEDNNAHMIKRLLSLRTSLFGRNVQRGQIGALYLLLPPSPQTHRFGHELNVSRRHIIDFPDLERLLLLYVQHYIGEPLFIPEPLALPSGEGKNGSANALLQSPAAQNTQSTPQANGAASTTPPPTAKGSSVSKRARTPSQGDASSVQGTAQTAPQSNPNAETGTQATPVVNTSAQGTTSL